MDKLMSIPEFAERLGVTQSCIRRWIFERKINAIKIGRLVRFAESEVDRIIAEGTRPARRPSEEDRCHR